MTKINCYQTKSADLVKTFCKISEKCYYNDYRTLVIAPNENYMQDLDKSLWTYSKQHFIPHATINDERYVEANIVISTNLETTMSFNVIIFVNPIEQTILNILSSNTTSPNHLEKLIFIYDEFNEINSYNINNLLKTSSFNNCTLSAFRKDDKNNWIQIIDNVISY